MTKNKQLKWRLGKLPTPDEVRELVKDKIITQEEARDILFNEETEESRDEDSLKAEIKFLRELVEKLSSHSQIVETIRYIEKPYVNKPWYDPYTIWCSAGTVTTYAGTSSGSGITNAYTSTSSGFGDIRTF